MRDGAEKSFIGGRIDLPTEKTSREIARDIPAAIRARAFLSARLADAHLLEQFRRVSDAYSSGLIGRDEARNLLLPYAREAGRDDGTRSLRNLASTARLNRILDQNAKMARAVGQYEAMHRPANLRMFPYVIYRASVGSKTPRDSHKRYDGMVIDKRDPWLRTHWPPWEFGCNCDLQNCTAKKAETLGTVKPMSDPEDVKIESDSGFSFDPAHAFEKFDYSLVKDPGLREEAREGVEKILSESSTASAPYDTSKPADIHREENTSSGEIVSLEKLAQDGGDRIRIGVPKGAEELCRELGCNAIARETTIREVLQEVNPKYKGDPKTDLYSVNCQRAVYAYEARRRGLDVVAKPALDLNYFKDKVAQKYLTVMRNSQPSLFTSAEKLLDKILSMPNGGRAVIRADWDNTHGHAFIAEKIGGRILLLDPQTGKDASDYLGKAKKDGKFIFSRIDNLDFDINLLKEMCEARK